MTDVIDDLRDLPADTTYRARLVPVGAVERAIRELEELRAKLSTADATIAKLPKTADRVTLIPGMELWALEYMGGRQPDNAFIFKIESAHGWSRGGDGGLWVTDAKGSNCARLNQVYSTKAAAEAAREKTEGQV